MKKFIAIFAALAILLTQLVGCGSAGEEDKTLNVSMISDITALDPAFAYDGPTISVMLQITEGLLKLNTDGTISPMLAKDWEAVDPTTYVYNIRDDVCFSDGTPMTMEDVLFSLNRYRDENVASYLMWMYENVESIEQTGDWQLTVKLYEPDATWQYVFSTAAGHIVKKEACEKAGDDFGKPAALLADMPTIGTGPYKVKSWSVGSEVSLVKNENYWDKSYAETDVDNINFIVISDDTTRMQALSSGQIDIDTMLPSEMISTVRDSEGTDVLLKKSSNFILLAMNCEVAPFDDVNVRRAIASLIDKQAIADGIVGEAGEAATALPMCDLLYTPENDSWKSYAESQKGIVYSVENAKNYLAQSAYPDGFECTLMVDEQNVNGSITLEIQSALKEIGITVNIDKVSQDELVNCEFGGDMKADGTRNFEMGLFEWEADYTDMSGNITGIFHSAFLGEGGSNIPSYSNPEVDALLDQQAASIDSAERAKILQQALDIITDEVPIVPIAYTYYKIGYRDRIESGIDILTWAYYIKDIKLKD